VAVDDVPEDQRIEQREDLIDRRQKERENDEAPVRAQIPGEGTHEEKVILGGLDGCPTQRPLPVGSTRYLVPRLAYWLPECGSRSRLGSEPEVSGARTGPTRDTQPLVSR